MGQRVYSHFVRLIMRAIYYAMMMFYLILNDDVVCNDLLVSMCYDDRDILLGL